MSFNFPDSWGPSPGAQFPYTQTGALNMDWVIQTVAQLKRDWFEVKPAIQDTVVQWLKDNKQSLVSVPGVDGVTLDFTKQYVPFCTDVHTVSGTVLVIKEENC